MAKPLRASVALVLLLGLLIGLLSGVPLLGAPDTDLDTVANDLAKLGLPALRALGSDIEEPDQLTALAAARARLEDQEIGAWLIGVAANARSMDCRAAAYDSLEAHGDARCLGPLLDNLPGDESEVKRHADRALRAVLKAADTNAAYQLVRDRLKSLGDEDRARVVTAVAKVDSPRGMALLGETLGRYANLDLSILAGLAGMKTQPDNPSLAQSLRPLTGSEDSNLRREAVSALGNLHDADSVEEFLELLGGEHAGVAGNAHWALRKISGLNLPREPLRWKMWLGEERSWWEEEGEALLRALEEGDEALILRALHQASLHRLYRNRFCDLIEEYAQSSEPAIRAAAERALERLGLRDRPTGRRSAGAGGAFASLQPVPASAVLDVLVPVKKKSREDESPEPGSTNHFLLVLGLPVCLALMIKVSGLAPVTRLRAWLARDDGDRGPVTVKLSRRGKRKIGGPTS